jgi:hypothetical protein
MKTLTILGRTLLLAAALFVSAGLSGNVRTADAGFDTCRGDPVVTLSDGTVMDVSVAIGTAASNVRYVWYTIHLPQAVAITSVTYTPLVDFQGKEVLMQVQDMRPGNYGTDASVWTTTKGVSVSQTTTGLVRYDTISGYSGDFLRVRWSQSTGIVGALDGLSY